jgi:hypothetical protein
VTFSKRENVERYQKSLALGQEAARKGNHSEALAAYTQALMLRPGDAGAKEGLRRAQQAREQSVAVTQQKADVLENLRREQEARLLAQKKAASYESSMTYGRLAFSKSQWDAASAAFNQALSDRPGDAEAQSALEKARQASARATAVASEASAKSLSLMRRREEGERTRQKALASAKTKAQMLAKQKEEQDADLIPQLLATARAALELKRPKLALPALEEAAKLDPDNRTVARYYQFAQRIAKAEEETVKELATQELFQFMPLDLKEEKAVRAAKVAVRLDEGRRLLSAGQHGEAVREFEAVLELSPGHAAATKSLKKARGSMR